MLSLLFCNQDEHVDASQILEKEYGYPKEYLEPEVFMKSWAHEIVVEAEEKGLKKGLRACLASLFNGLKLLDVAFQRVERWLE